ncbi:hypothetical protein SFHH103_psfHH103d_245 (plasmid) [Sinorhizobium fredii HH103]|nr:hypothetical protein SFHH103_psfHH103d_245 [Sinorhizobium fredii HH103]
MDGGYRFGLRRASYWKTDGWCSVNTTLPGREKHPEALKHGANGRFERKPGGGVESFEPPRHVRIEIADDRVPRWRAVPRH